MNEIRRPHASAGFSLLEMLIAAALVAIVMIGLLQLLDGASRVSKIQNDMAQMTETLRFTVDDMVRTMRMAGTGGLPLLAPSDATGTNFQVIAVTVQDNVASGGFSVTDAGGTTWTALPGTDVLTVRGVIGGELYDLAGTTQITGYDPSSGADTEFSVRLTRQSPFTAGRIQPLPSRVTAGTPLLFTLLWELPVAVAPGQVRYFSKYNIGIIKNEATPDSSGDFLDLVVDTADSNYQAILDLNEGGDFEPFQQNYVITAGFMDDLVYFVSLNPEGEPALFLWQQSDNSVAELVDNIWSLQAALGCDTNNDGQLTENGSAADDDEWIFNAPGDSAPTAAQMVLLQEVRVSLTGRTAHPDLEWNVAPEMPENAPAVTGDDRYYRYRSHSVRVTLRSHPPLT